MEADLPSIVILVRDMGPEFEPFAEQLEQNPHTYVMWAFDTSVGPSGGLTNAAIAHETVPPSVPIATYVELVTAGLPPGFQVLETEVHSKASTALLVIEIEVTGVIGKELVHIHKDGADVWILTLATSADEFDSRRSDFDLIIASFQTPP